MNSSFTEQIIEEVWRKATPIPGKDPNIIRKESCGASIIRSKHGDTNSSFGWEIDHIIPKSKGGSDNISNLQPLQWENNRAKSDNVNWQCVVTY